MAINWRIMISKWWDRFIRVEGNSSYSMLPYAHIFKITIKNRHDKQRILRMSKVDSNLSPLASTDYLNGSISSLLGNINPDDVYSIN
jgi:hypothetical protein